MKDLVVLQNQELELLEQSKAANLKKSFTPIANGLKELEDQYNLIISDAKKGGIDSDISGRARELRLKLRKVRTEADAVHKKLKQDILVEGRAIDGMRNIIKQASSGKEENLLKIEKHHEIQEAKRLDSLEQSRIKKLSPYVSDFAGLDLRTMQEDVFEAFLAKKISDKKALEEAERKAEQERKAKEEAFRKEQERIRAENERLKKEAEAAEKARKAELEKIQKQRAAEEKARKAELEKIRKAQQEAEAKARKAEQGRLLLQKQAEEKARKEAEQKELENSRKDADKIKALTKDLANLKGKYSFRSKSNQEKAQKVDTALNQLIAYLSK